MTGLCVVGGRTIWLRNHVEILMTKSNSTKSCSDEATPARRAADATDRPAGSKRDQLRRRLEREGGASLKDLERAFGWQPHTPAGRDLGAPEGGSRCAEGERRQRRNLPDRRAARVCLMRQANAEQDLPERLREIAALDRSGCVQRWEQGFGTPPPRHASVRFMQRVLARDVQIKVAGDYPAQIRRELRAAADAVRRKEVAPRTAAPGSYLVREWNGRTYRVEVTANGYVLDGQTYPSLTTIAKHITGAHWSGPRFFGLRPRRAA
jgi:hypothetical protein